VLMNTAFDHTHLDSKDGMLEGPPQIYFYSHS
ncbi:MAG: hypothetical protein RLZZ59_538, partial [Pseudomonadota bacterium]